MLTPVTAWIPFLAWGIQARRPAWIALSAVYACAIAGSLVLNDAAGDEGPLSDQAALLMWCAWGTAALNAVLLWHPFALPVMVVAGGVQCIALGLRASSWHWWPSASCCAPPPPCSTTTCLVNPGPEAQGVPSGFGTPGPPQVEPWASRRSAWPREY